MTARSCCKIMMTEEVFGSWRITAFTEDYGSPMMTQRCKMHTIYLPYNGFKQDHHETSDTNLIIFCEGTLIFVFCTFLKYPSQCKIHKCDTSCTCAVSISLSPLFAIK